MASSLEELLKEEGFRGRRSATRARTSFGSDNVTTPSYRPPRLPKSGPLSSSDRVKHERARSDVSRYSFKGKLSKCDGNGEAQTRDSLIARERMRMFKAKGSVERQDNNRRSNASSDELLENEIVEIGVGKDGRKVENYYEMDSNGREDYNGRLGKVLESGKYGHSSLKKPSGHISNDRKINGSFDRESRSSSKTLEDNRNKKETINGLSDPVIALDEVAIRATISILAGYITRFLKEQEFRTTLRFSCFSSLELMDSEVCLDAESKVISNLKQAIERVEEAAEEPGSVRDLKKSMLQLSVITGLNSVDLKDAFTCGIPNSKLSAIAHLYLSVIYKIQKKDRVSAKHLLQVFADSPLQARTIWLPDLWEDLFSPHFSNLKMWHSQEVESLLTSPNKGKKLKHLEKVYAEILDSGTNQFAVYYKDWLTEGQEAPSFPSISIPYSVEMSSPDDPPYSQPMVSRRLYEAVFGCSSDPGNHSNADVGEDDDYCSCSKSSAGSVGEVQEKLPHPYEMVKHIDEYSVENSSKDLGNEAFMADGLVPAVEEENVSADQEGRSNSSSGGNTSRENADVELILRMLAESIFECQPEDSPSTIMASLPQFDEETSPSHLSNSIEAKQFSKKLQSSHEFSDETSSAVPQHLICPLTGKLFEDPVTLETGQTFERAAIRKWFDQGNGTCPVTGTTLECSTLPLTNLVIKRVNDCWRINHCRSILTSASEILEAKGSVTKDREAISILEQLLTAYTKEERIANAKYFISLGGLQYLIRRFESGVMEEKIRVAALMLCCIEADAGCRNQVAEDINEKFLLDLLHSKQNRARKNAVYLLIELICLNRRNDGLQILNSLQDEEIVNSMHVLLQFLRSCPFQERPLVAVLLLHFDLLIDARMYSIYREEAVDAIALALNLSLSDQHVKEQCCQALSALEGCFSASKEPLIPSLILKQAQPTELPEADDTNSSPGLKNLLESLICNGSKSFLETVSKCLSSGDSNLSRSCLIMVARMSSALSSLTDAQLQLQAFSALVWQLKEHLEADEHTEHKILASFTLLNFCKVPECRALLMTIAEEIAGPLRFIADETWTAKQLYAIISEEE